MHALFGYAHAQAHLGARRLSDAARRRFRGAVDERGQGTVEYVGLILLVSPAHGWHGRRHEGLQ